MRYATKWERSTHKYLCFRSTYLQCKHGVPIIVNHGITSKRFLLDFVLVSCAYQLNEAILDSAIFAINVFLGLFTIKRRSIQVRNYRTEWSNAGGDVTKTNNNDENGFFFFWGGKEMKPLCIICSLYKKSPIFFTVYFSLLYV